MTLPPLRAFLPVAVALGVLAAICAGVVWGFLYLEFDAPFKGRTFEAAGWQAAKGTVGAEGCKRCVMVENLVAEHLPTDRAGMAQLLGPPDKTRQAARGYDGCDAYLLGLDLRVSAWWNEAWLYVCYRAGGDGKDRVAAAFPLVF
jgi:hypothetical protein